MTTSLVTWLVEKLVDWFNLDPVDIWPEKLDPITKLQRLDDDPRAVYVWVLGEDATQKDVEDWAARINRVYLEAYGHAPNAAHVPVRGVEDVKQLSSLDMERALKPWLREQPGQEGT